jgi:hypothetical protein
MGLSLKNAANQLARLHPATGARSKKLAALIAVSAVLTACTVGDVMRPSVDVGATAAIPSSAIIQPLPPQRVQVPAAPILAAPPANLDVPLQPDAPLLPPQQPEDGIVYLPPSAGLNVEPPAGDNDYPPLSPQDQQLAMVVPEAPPAGSDVEPTQDDPGMLAQLAALPGRMVPSFLKPGANDPESQCRRELKRLGVTYEDVAPVGNGRGSGSGGCGIANPVRITKLSGGTVIKPAAVLNCQMAVRFAEWVKKDVQPTARTRYWSGVAEIKNMSSYSCRTIGNKRGGRLSEHSYGNAIDIGGVTLKSGRKVAVKKPGFFALRESSLLNKIRSDACDRFTTVLGPGYNSDHADHFHLDLMARKHTSCN